MELTRELQLKRSALISGSEIGEDNNVVEISFSSELPVLRDFGYEVLQHSNRSINSERINGGLPVLWNHNWDVQIGRAERIYLDQATKKLRAVVRFSQRQVAQEVLQDIRDGIIKDVSFGYTIDEWEVVRANDPAEPDTVVATRWTPFETSFVSIPADITVGVGRSLDEQKEEEKEEEKQQETQAKLEEAAVETEAETAIETSQENELETHIEETNEQRSIENGKTESIISNIQNNLREVPILKGKEYMTSNRQETIALLGVAEKLGVVQEAREMLASERSIEEIRTELMNLAASKQATVASTPAIDARDLKGYSISRAIRAQMTGDWSKAGLEREASEHMVRTLGRDTAGFLVPTSAFRAANTHNTQTVGQGKELLFAEYAGFVDLLRPQCKVMGLGAQVIGGLTNNYTFVQETSAPTTYWVGENPGTDVTDTKMGFTTKTLSPKQLMASMSYTKLQLLQSVENFDSMLMARLVREHAIAIDAAAIGYKTAVSNAPAGGLLLESGIPVTALATNGQAITNTASIAAVLGLKTAVNKANALVDSCAYLTTPDIQGKLESVVPPGLQYAAAPYWQNGTLSGYRAVSSSNVPTNLDKGTSTGLCHPIIFGDFSQLLIGDFGALDITTDPYTLAGQGVVKIVSNQLADVGILRPTAFAMIKDALNS